MNHLERLYEAAAQAGLLNLCIWRPSDGSPEQVVPVGFAAPDVSLLDGLALSGEYMIVYPASALTGLDTGETVALEGHLYQVRSVRSVGDGTERRAMLSRR